MKKLSLTLCFLILMTAITLITQVAVSADVIWEPYDDNFYIEHREECVLCERVFLANGKEGYIRLYKSPTSKVVVDSCINGYGMGISHTYTDSKGVEWGVSFAGGWVRMSEVVVKYDNVSFEEEHVSEISNCDEKIDCGNYETIPFWTYPNSGDMNAELRTADFDDTDVYVYRKWTDENGTVWGKVSYFYAVRDSWINISAPDKRDYPLMTHEYDLYPAVDEIPDVSSAGPVTIVIVLIAVVISVTAFTIIIFVFRQKKKKIS